MQRYFRFSFLLVTGYWLLVTGYAIADTVYTKDGRELKGIVVEDYKDRITFSTADGETMLMKSDIAELEFDTEEDNLINLAEQARDKNDFNRAYAYYEMAYKINPDSKRAKDGLVFAHGYIFREEQARKEEDVKKWEALEQYGAHIESEKSYEGELKASVDRLKKTIGIGIGMKGSQPEVITVDAGSPAYEAGIRRGDILAAIWGRLTGYMLLNEILDILLKKPALEIKCTVERRIDVRINEDRALLSGPEGLIGASLTMEFDGLTVSNIKENSASSEAGLKQDDLIVIIDGQSTRYMPLKKAIELIRDSKENAVVLTIRRELILWRKERSAL